MSSTDSKKVLGPSAATAFNNVSSGHLAWSSWIPGSQMKTFTSGTSDQLVLLVLDVQLVLEVQSTSALINGYHLKVFISNVLDLQLLRLQTHKTTRDLAVDVR